MNCMVIDANIVFNAVMKNNGNTYRIIMWDTIHLYAPDFLLFEIEKYQKLFIKKWIRGYRNVINELATHISFISMWEYTNTLLKIEQYMKDIDIKDTPYVTLSHVMNIPLRTNDKTLHKKIDIIQLYSTEDVLQLR